MTPFLAFTERRFGGLAGRLRRWDEHWRWNHRFPRRRRVLLRLADFLARIEGWARREQYWRVYPYRRPEGQ